MAKHPGKIFVSPVYWVDENATAECIETAKRVGDFATYAIAAAASIPEIVVSHHSHVIFRHISDTVDVLICGPRDEGAQNDTWQDMVKTIKRALRHLHIGEALTKAAVKGNFASKSELATKRMLEGHVKKSTEQWYKLGGYLEMAQKKFKHVGYQWEHNWKNTTLHRLTVIVGKDETAKLFESPETATNMRVVDQSSIAAFTARLNKGQEPA